MPGIRSGSINVSLMEIDMKQVYVHGLGQTPASWEKTILNLKNNRQSICPNLSEIVRGEEVNYQNLYKAFSNFCNEIHGHIDLCGLSLGAVLALNYAIDYPEKVHSMVLIAAQYKMPKKLLQFQNVIFRFMPKSTFRQIGFAKTEFIELSKTMMELDFSKSIQKVSCPVLVVCGDKDSANKKASVELAGILENAELQVVNGSGHEINVEAPEELAEVLRAFYNRISQI